MIWLWRSIWCTEREAQDEAQDMWNMASPSALRYGALNMRIGAGA